MKRAELLCAAALLLVAGVVVAEAIRLGPGWGPSGPRAGFFPFWLAVILAACCALNLGRALALPAGGPPLLGREGARPALAVFLPMLATIALMQLLGFYASATLYLAYFARRMGGHSWRSVALVSLLFPLAVFLVIERWFLIPLPKGMLGDTILYPF